MRSTASANAGPVRPAAINSLTAAAIIPMRRFYRPAVAE